jgi:hypothetical protein
MNNEQIDRINLCSNLLPPPGDKVVQQVISELKTTIKQRDDLLEALKEASAYIYGEYWHDHPTVIKIREAIEKAGG